jgi:gas vesicle protein
MSRSDSTGVIFGFLVGIGVGATAVILLGSKRIDQLHDEVIEVINDGVKELRRQAQKTVNAARQKLDEAIDIGADAYNEAKKS